MYLPRVFGIGKYCSIASYNPVEQPLHLFYVFCNVQVLHQKQTRLGKIGDARRFQAFDSKFKLGLEDGCNQP